MTRPWRPDRRCGAAQPADRSRPSPPRGARGTPKEEAEGKARNSRVHRRWGRDQVLCWRPPLHRRVLERVPRAVRPQQERDAQGEHERAAPRPHEGLAREVGVRD